MKEALKEAHKAFDKNECPIGCVIVKDGKVFVRAHNLRLTHNNALAHAEVVAINKACRKLGDFRLENCDMYVTLEPCTMCSGALIHSRLNNLYFGAYDLKTGACGSRFNILGSCEYNHIVNVTGGILKEECQNIISDFFKARRKMQKEGRDWIVESGKVRSWQKNV